MSINFFCQLISYVLNGVVRRDIIKLKKKTFEQLSLQKATLDMFGERFWTISGNLGNLEQLVANPKQSCIKIISGKSNSEIMFLRIQTDI